MLTKIALSKLHCKKFSVHIKSKKLNVIKIHTLELASYILSAVNTPQEIRAEGKKVEIVKKDPVDGCSGVPLGPSIHKMLELDEPSAITKPMLLTLSRWGNESGN